MQSMNNVRFALSAIVAALALALTACGGGGGDSAPAADSGASAPPPATAASTPEEISAWTKAKKATFKTLIDTEFNSAKLAKDDLRDAIIVPNLIRGLLSPTTADLLSALDQKENLMSLAINAMVAKWWNDEQASTYVADAARTKGYLTLMDQRGNALNVGHDAKEILKAIRRLQVMDWQNKGNGLPPVAYTTPQGVVIADVVQFVIADVKSAMAKSLSVTEEVLQTQYLNPLLALEVQ